MGMVVLSNKRLVLRREEKMQYCNTKKSCKYKHDCCNEQTVVDGDKKCTFSDWCLYQEIIEDDKD